MSSPTDDLKHKIVEAMNDFEWQPPVEEGTFADYTFEAWPVGVFPEHAFNTWWSKRRLEYEARQRESEVEPDGRDG